jgi:cytochrome P450
MADVRIPGFSNRVARPGDVVFPSPEVLECPYPFYSALRRDAPVYRLPGRDVFFVSRWQDIAYVAAHPELFSAGRGGQASLGLPPGTVAGSACPVADAEQVERSSVKWSSVGLSACDGPEHRAKRSVALKLVAPDRLRGYEPDIERAVSDMIDGFAARGEAELVADFATPLPLRVTCDLLGMPRDDELFLQMMDQVPSSAVRFLSDDERDVRQALGLRLHDHVRRTIVERYENPRADFLSEFIADHVRLAGELPLDYLIVEATTLLFGGLVTTQHMLTNTVFLLLSFPEQLRRVLDDPTLIRPMLDESLRLETPFHLTEMICTADTEIAGVPIPEGAAVYKLWGSGNRDESMFAEPEDFQIGRSGVAKHHLGFGRGSHRCLGAPLALLEGTIAIRALLARLPNLRFAPDKNDWRHVHTTGFRALERLHLRFDPS